MVLSGVSPGWVAGIALTAGAVFVALHFLRIQPRQHQVLTLLFWRQLADRNRTPVFFGRFRNLLSLLLLLLIAATITISLLGLKREHSGPPMIVVVDAGLSMSAPEADGTTRMDEAKRIAGKIMDAAGSQPLVLIAADPMPRVLVRGDDPMAIRRKMLAGLRPSETHALAYDSLLLALGLSGNGSANRIYWITDARKLPDGIMNREKIDIFPVGDSQSNAAILSSVYLPDAGELLVRAGYWGEKDSELTLSAKAAGQTVYEQKLSASPSASLDFRIRAAADGSKLLLELSGVGGVAGDDRAEITLPKMERPQFAISENIPRPLRLALLAIGNMSESAEAIRVGGVSAPSAKQPGIVIIGEGDRMIADNQTIMVNGADSPVSAINFEGARIGKGPDLRGLSYDVEPLVFAGDGVVAAITRGEQPRTLYLSSALFTAGSEAPRRAAFPVFLMRAASMLRAGGLDPIAISAVRAQADPFWVKQQERDGKKISVLAGERVQSNLTMLEKSSMPPLPASQRLSPDIFEMLLGVSFVLLLIEAFLTIRGKVV